MLFQKKKKNRLSNESGAGTVAMRQQVLFVQGGGDGAHQMDARMVASLMTHLGPDYRLNYPAMPNEDAPDYLDWKERLKQELARIGEDILVVGHSLGGATAIKLLAEAEPALKVKGIFLIAAPFFGAGGWQSAAFKTPDNLGTRLGGSFPMFLYHGGNDEIVPSAHIELYARKLPGAVVRRLARRDHQLNEDLSEIARDISRL